MKKLLLLLLLLSMPAFGQTTVPTQVVKKFVGEATTFSFEYSVEDEDMTSHFELRWIDDLTKTTITLKTIAKSQRGTTISAAFTPGFKFTYYNIVAVYLTPNSVSAPSNTVATERVGRPARNLSVN